MEDRTGCVDCGAPRQSQSPRCDACRREHRLESERQRNRRRPARPNRPWTRQCDMCGDVFTRAGGPAYRCDACPSGVLGALYGPTVEDIGPLHDVAEPERLTCSWCNLGFWRGHGRGRKFCSNVCENYGRGRVAIVTEITFGDCRRCGSTYCKPSRYDDNGFCSQRCTNRVRKQADKYRRRAHKRAGERFTLREIAERDNWRCHLCGKKVPDRDYAARDDDPTLDHLVPVSAGGEHTRANVALAHNRCNWERGDTPIEFQQRLIA